MEASAPRPFFSSRKSIPDSDEGPEGRLREHSGPVLSWGPSVPAAPTEEQRVILNVSRRSSDGQNQ